MLNKLIVTLVMFAILTSACTSVESDPETQPAVEISLVKSDLAREKSPQVSPQALSSLVEGNSDFAFKFYDQIRQEDDNLLFSPLSLSLALSMTLAGAENSTEDAMLKGLQHQLSDEDLHSAINALLLLIEESQNEISEDREGSSFKLYIANSIWGQAGLTFNKDFLDNLALNYGAGIFPVDFITQPEEARQLINQWVEEATEGRIQDLIPPDAFTAFTRMVLANAIYFNGSWLYPFEENGTSPATFTLLDGSQTQVEMMSLPGKHLFYASGENYQLVQLPYLSQDFLMTVILPDTGQFAELEEHLDRNFLDQMASEVSQVEVNLKMPKFEFSTTLNANEVLSDLGMAEAFDPEAADFSGMTLEEALFITDVVHKADIKVDERGTEAAAATAVIMGIKSMMPGEPISLVVDRPFLFFIQHRPTGSILFMGRVIQP